MGIVEVMVMWPTVIEFYYVPGNILSVYGYEVS